MTKAIATTTVIKKAYKIPIKGITNNEGNICSKNMPLLIT